MLEFIQHPVTVQTAGVLLNVHRAEMGTFEQQLCVSESAVKENVISENLDLR